MPTKANENGTEVQDTLVKINKMHAERSNIYDIEDPLMKINKIHPEWSNIYGIKYL